MITVSCKLIQLIARFFNQISKGFRSRLELIVLHPHPLQHTPNKRIRQFMTGIIPNDLFVCNGYLFIK